MRTKAELLGDIRRIEHAIGNLEDKLALCRMALKDMRKQVARLGEDEPE